MLNSLLWYCLWKYRLHNERVTLCISISAAFHVRRDKQEIPPWPLQSVLYVAYLFRLCLGCYLVPWIMNWISRTVPRRSIRPVLSHCGLRDYTNDTEMGPVDGGVDSSLSYLRFYFPPAPSGLCEPAQSLHASESCHVFFSINIRVHRIAGWMEGSVAKYAGGNSIAAREGWEGGR